MTFFDIVADMSSESRFSFFDYHCDQCDGPVCERVQLMNLALGYEVDLYCMDCLAQIQALTPVAVASFAKGYIQSRDCFKDPWLKFNASACPKQEQQACFCQNLDDPQNPEETPAQ